MNSNLKNPMRVREARAAAHRPDNGEAFLPDPTATEKHGVLTHTDVEFFAEEFIASATTGEQVEMEAGDEVIEEEWGGPFLELDMVEETDLEVTPEPPATDKLPPTFSSR